MEFRQTPNKLITGTVENITSTELWPYEISAADPFWSGGTTPRHYRWLIEININTQTHSGFDTRLPFSYNGEDVRVGDWIAGTGTGTAYKIISIESKTPSTITAIIEDVERYNGLRNSASNGIGVLTDTVVAIFSIDTEGLPLVDPLPGTGISIRFFPNLQARFQSFNKQQGFNLVQPSHSFMPGDVVSVDSSIEGFVLGNPAGSTVVGTVKALGPGPDRFYLSPVQRIKDDFDFLPGTVGSVLYVDNSSPGELTTDDASGKMVYVKLREFTSTRIAGTVLDPTVSFADVLRINGQDVVFTGTSLANAVNDINGVTSPGIVASVNLAPNIIQTSETLAYGPVGLFIDGSGPAEATINGVTVVFDIDDDGQQRFGQPVCSAEDMATVIARDMTAANNTDIFAERISNAIIRLTNRSGGSITIVNTVNDKNGNGFAGPGSGSGLPLNTAASTEEIIVLTAADARPINLRSITGTPTADLGIFSVENGQKAAALYVEKGLRDGTTTVVADIAGRDALTPMVGDQAYVLDRGNGEWALFLWDGGQWVQVADEDSARTDADSLSLTITEASGAEELIGTVSNNSRVTLITVTVTQAFDGAPEMTIGDTAVNDRLMGDDQIDLTVTGTYTTQSNHLYDTGGDTDLNVYFDAGGATEGSATIVVTYV